MKIAFFANGERIRKIEITTEGPDDHRRLVKADPGLHQGLYRANITSDGNTLTFERVDYPARQPNPQA